MRHHQGVGSANERRGYIIAPPLIGWAHTKNDLWSLLYSFPGWPRIICSSHAYFASVGEEVLISCRVDAYPPISFLELVYPDQQGRLTAVTLKDAGTINIPEETAVDDMTVHIDVSAGEINPS